MEINSNQTNNLVQELYSDHYIFFYILLYQKANNDEKADLKNLFEKNDRNEEEFKRVLLMIKNYNIVSGCYAKAEYFINLASNSLSIFDETKEKEILKNLTSFSLERSY